MTQRFIVELRETSEQAKKFLDPSMHGPTYHVVDSETGKSVPFGGYGHRREAAESRAKRENEKVSTC